MKVNIIKSTILILLLIGGVANTLAQNIRTPRTYVVHKAESAIKIDGKADEKTWDNAPWSADFIDIEGNKTPKYKTNLKMLWDEENLYFYAHLEEPHVWATLKQRDTIIFYNNDFEVFIDPDGDTQNYMEFEMNALNTVWDLLMVKAYRDGGPIIYNWDINGLKSAVSVEGSINNASDTDKSWSIEIAMPWSVLKEPSGSNKLPIGDFWRINFSRVNWDFELNDGKYYRKKDAKGNFLPEYNWVWSPQGVINMHEPEHWGYAYFSEKTKGDSFIIPKDEQIKWYLYSLYRAQKSYTEKYGKPANALSVLGLEPHTILGKTITVKFTNTIGGWFITAVSPFTGNQLTVQEDGDFQLKKTDS